MNVKWTLVLLVVVSVAAFAGDVLARSLAGPAATQLGKAVFDEIDLNSHKLPVYDDRAGGNGDRIPAGVWQALLKSKGLSDVYVVDNKFGPGATSGWHSHPGPSLILVVSGAVTNYTSDDPSCSPHVYSAGGGFIDEGGQHRHLLRNESGAPAETIAVQILPKDAPRKTDATPPSGCGS